MTAQTKIATTCASEVAGAEAPRRSFRNRSWQEPAFSDAEVEALVAFGANALTAPILAARGFAPETVGDFVAPTIRGLLPNPSFFVDMDRAADRLAAAIVGGETLAIWSDYDVDGATSAATLGRFLRDCGRPDFMLHIPDRITEGYGPNADGLARLHDAGASLVCVLDSGTTAFEPLEAARARGLDVVVIDHHAAEETLPPAVALVNPNRLDQEPGYNHVCAAGMTFIFCVAVNLRLRQRGWFDGEDGRPARSPDLMGYLDLVALGTICDVVPLTTLNRAFVMRGLPILTERRLPGVSALAEIAGCADEIDARACGFALGPRINAGGRIGEADAGARLLLAQDAGEAELLASTLDELNRDRQEMEKACTAAALEQCRDDFVPGETRKLAIAVTDAHEGVVGISAARLKEALDAPAFVLAPTPEGELKGSGRSVSGFDLGAAIIAARKAGLLIKGGGHAMAGGITLDPARLDEFVAFMNAAIDASEYASTGVVSRIDNVLALPRATVGLADAVQALAPFGMGNPTPRFMIAGVLLADIRILKDVHIKCVFEVPELGPAGPRIEAPVWNAVGTPFGDALTAARGQVVDILGSLEVNEWRGVRRIQLKLEDARPA